MKRTYTQPKTECLPILSQSIICNSVGGGADEHEFRAPKRSYSVWMLILAFMLLPMSMQAVVDPSITLTADGESSYTPTSIRYGNFDDSKIVDTGSPKTDRGWYTTDSRIELSSNMNTYNTTLATNGNNDGHLNFIELNADHESMLYQDLTTHGHDVIRWSLDHAVRLTAFPPEVQSMRVEIGGPYYNGETPYYPSGTGVSINTQIDPTYLVRYESTGITNPAAGTFGYEADNLSNLSLNINTDYIQWYNCSGIYIIPDDQTITRFGFISTSNGTNPSAGNLMDNVTFSTLIGNLSAEVQSDGSLSIKGYWGETNASKKMNIEIGGTTYEIDMSSIVGGGNKNFAISVPQPLIGTATNINVYHESYPEANREVDIDNPYCASVTPEGEATVYYETFAEAIAAANSCTKDNTLRILKDVTYNTAFNFSNSNNKKITFDVEDHSFSTNKRVNLSTETEFRGHGAITVNDFRSTADVTVQDSIIFTFTISGKGTTAWFVSGGHVIINGGYFTATTSDGTIKSSGGSTVVDIYAGDFYNGNQTNWGTIIGSNSSHTNIYGTARVRGKLHTNNSAVITLYNGSKYNYNTPSGGSFTVAPWYCLTTNTDADASTYGYKVIPARARTTNNGGSSWTYYLGLQQAVNAVDDNTSTVSIVELIDDFTMTSSISTGAKKFTLRSCSERIPIRTITPNHSGSIFSYSNGFNMTLENIILDGTATSTSGLGTYANGTLSLEDGTIIRNMPRGGQNNNSFLHLSGASSRLNIYAGALVENCSSDWGLIRMDAAGTINMYGGLFQNISANRTEGQVFWNKFGTVNISGGTITNCTGGNAAVWLHPTGNSTCSTLNISGGTITSNAQIGIVASDASCKVNISGTPNITNNTVGNIRISADNNLSLAGDFTGQAGVFHSTDAENAKGHQFGVTADDYAGVTNFFCDKNTDLIGVINGSTLIWTTEEEVFDDVNPVSKLESLHSAGVPTVLTIHRTLYWDSYNTLCLPFSMDAAAIAASPLAGAVLKDYVGADVSGEGDARDLNLHLTDLNEIVAGKPFLIQPPVNIVNPVFENVLITWDEAMGENIVCEHVDLQGIVAPIDLAGLYSSSPDYLGIGSDGRLYWADATKTTGDMRGFRAFFHVKDAGAALSPVRRGMRALFVNDTRKITTDTETTNATNTTDNSTTKLLRNGQLLIIKDGIRYNAQGQVVE